MGRRGCIARQQDSQTASADSMLMSLYSVDDSMAGASSFDQPPLYVYGGLTRSMIIHAGRGAGFICLSLHVFR